MRLLLLLSVFGLAACAAKFEFLEEWNMWKDQHGKGYESEVDELERHLNWLSNREYINLHNANTDVFGFTLAMNQFGDLTDTEFKERYLTYERMDYSQIQNKVPTFEPQPFTYYPESLDWRTRGAVTNVKTQGNCGASYAFSTTGALEGSYALAFGTLTSLSEQNLVDCSVPNGNHGCHGGNMYNAFMYILENEGVDTENCYPYQGTQSTCAFNESAVGASISGIIAIQSGSESDLLAAVATTGPVSVAVDAHLNSFRFYSSGVYDTSRCSSYSINHAMLVTGYGQYNGKYFWLIKNSWGKNWGISGYIMMSRHRYNQCGIASDASFPTL